MKNTYNIDLNKINFDKMDGLIPCIVQDYCSKEVLMLGYQNREALEKTLEIEKVTFWSRTKKRLWTKGETSNNFLKVINIKIDCDQDTILIKVKAPTETCHKNQFSCFGEKTTDINFLTELTEVIKDRQINGDKESYIKSLFNYGLDRIAQKVGEEAVETVIEAKNNNKQDFIYESSDLLFHLLILCTAKDVSIEDLIEELQKRVK